MDLSKKKILIVGGGGFLGYWATKEFLNKGFKVDILTLPPKPKQGLFDQSVKIISEDINNINDTELIDLLKNYYGVVFAAGKDDRVTPKAPAYPYFYKHNVITAKRFFNLARSAKVKKGVLLSSYFAYFARKWPDLKLEKYHPYIKSRIEQEKECLKVCSEELKLTILELPYIFGTMPNYKPLWTPLIQYVKNYNNIYYTPGGTNMIGVENVAEAIVGAIEKGKFGKTYLIGDQNITWKDFLQKIAKIINKKIKVITLPNYCTKTLFSFLKFYHFLQGKEGGLDPIKLVELQSKKTFFDPTESRNELGYGQGNLDKSLEQTIISSLSKNN